MWTQGKGAAAPVSQLCCGSTGTLTAWNSLEAVLQFDLDIGAQLDIIKAEHAELGVFTKVQSCLSQLPRNLVSLSR